MTKRVVLSTGSGGLAGVDAALADLAQDASGDGTKALYGDGTFKTPGGGIQSATVTLSSAQLLALNSSPVTIVAAPGAGKIIAPVALCMRNSGGTAYDDSASSNSTGLYYNAYTGAAAVDDSGISSLATQAVGSAQAVSTSLQQNIYPLADIADQPIVAYSPVGNMTTGNGTITVTMYYLTITL
jgi:hypothetical protein